MTDTFRATLMALALAGATFSASGGALAKDPTRGRIDTRLASTSPDYFRCARFSLSVYNACLGQAKGDSGKVRGCRFHYHGNLERCRATFR